MLGETMVAVADADADADAAAGEPDEEGARCNLISCIAPPLFG